MRTDDLDRRSTFARQSGRAIPRDTTEEKGTSTIQQQIEELGGDDTGDSEQGCVEQQSAALRAPERGRSMASRSKGPLVLRCRWLRTTVPILFSRSSDFHVLAPDARGAAGACPKSVTASLALVQSAHAIYLTSI